MGIYYILSICFFKAIAIKTATVDPIVLAKISVTSDALVRVMTPCKISIVIPKNTENIKEIKYALQSSGAFPFSSFLKNKIQEIVNPKWKQKCTILSILGKFTAGILFESVRQK